jgi:hypothetical protein
MVQVLNDFLNACREAISRNAAMFRGDEERADNVLEVSRCLNAPISPPLKPFNV